ncbi:imidazole glycerol phosphate synthase subunit HisH [Chryseobacterium fluminis]|uniref:imidazole glycerol phosphate synthase subunit HisH n=1 Tax=Chryseobacterium fluminis TaxID=2983606 RepID=UPI002258F985|nr:imidazole glycerol phosphate synthase subunit HisH [Chryseobacterium sp. MMS21-Ot14]UZT99699.1 imidazole glycerol phosphate synthase subunit HisH [Chryseobacterium sp. MMS21-Ot14]
MITIINYGIGNINAFVNIYKRLDIPVNIAATVDDLNNKVDKIILPGVGSFDYAMQRLTDSGMVDRLNELVLQEKKQVLGICVGMQLMAESSDEGTLNGLGWIKGQVKKLNVENIHHRSKLPHMGWNDVEPAKNHSIFNEINEKQLFYFLHSYYYKLENPENCLAVTHYGQTFASIIGKDNILGIQCHPEKSHEAGELFLKNFAKL